MPKGVYKKTKEHGKNISEALKKAGIKPLSRKGKHHTEEAKQKMSKAHKGKKLSEETKIKMGKARMGKNNPNWKGGQFTDGQGYVYIKMPEHPNVNKRGYVKRSRLVMEQYLDRYLEPEEISHHRNGTKDDDRIENLALFPCKAKHTAFHGNLKNKIKKKEII